jgi:hypothetical protein
MLWALQNQKGTQTTGNNSFFSPLPAIDVLLEVLTD